MIRSGSEMVPTVLLENLIAMADFVLEAAVVGVPDSVWGEKPMAIVSVRPGMEATEDDVIETSGKSSLRITQPSIFDTPNAVNMQYVNSEKEYADDEYVLADSAAVAADGDYREKEIALPGITSTANVMKMANYFLEKLRVNKTASLLMGSRGMVLEPEDVITLTHSRPG